MPRRSVVAHALSIPVGTVRYRMGPAPVRPIADEKTLLEDIKKMHADFVLGLKQLEKIVEQINLIKQGPPGEPGAGIDFGQMRDVVLKAMPLPEITTHHIAAIATIVAAHVKIPEPLAPQILPEHIATIVDEVVKKIPKIPGKRGKAGRPGTTSTAEQVLNLLKEKKLRPEHVEGLEQTLSAIKNANSGFRGGGDTVVAGTGVTITNTVNGNKQISVASSGSSTAQEKLTPTQSGSNVTLNLSLLTHTFVAILGVYKNGQLLDQNDAQFGWSRATNTITVLNGFDTDVYYVQYTYAS